MDKSLKQIQLTILVRSSESKHFRDGKALAAMDTKSKVFYVGI